MASKITEELLRGDRNHLTLLRFMLATMVVYTHAVESMGGTDKAETLIGVTMGWAAVDGFFALSGFLMCRSLEANGSIGRFAASRLLRIWPGMFVMCLVATIVYALFTIVPLSQYFLGKETLSFVFLNQVLVPRYTLTGVYCPTNGVLANEICAINGALWTIRWEVSCYVGIAALAVTGRLLRRDVGRFVLPALVLFALVFAWPPLHQWVAARPWTHIYLLEQIARLWTAFAIGAAAYSCRDRIHLSWTGALVALGVLYLTQSFFFAETVRAFAICYLVLCIGFLTARPAAFAARMPDYSFGVYIYHMPVMQVYRIAIPHIDPHLLALLAFVTVVPVAACSWHLVEKPAQDLRRNFRLPLSLRPQPG